MHIIVVGAGEVGSYVADLLSREGHDVAVVEKDPARLAPSTRASTCSPWPAAAPAAAASNGPAPGGPTSSWP